MPFLSETFETIGTGYNTTLSGFYWGFTVIWKYQDLIHAQEWWMLEWTHKIKFLVVSWVLGMISSRRSMHCKGNEQPKLQPAQRKRPLGAAKMQNDSDVVMHLKFLSKSWGFLEWSVLSFLHGHIWGCSLAKTSALQLLHILKPYIWTAFYEQRRRQNRRAQEHVASRMKEGKERYPISSGLTIETQSRS